MNNRKAFILIIVFFLVGIFLGAELQAQEQGTVYSIDGAENTELSTTKSRVKPDEESISERSSKEINTVSSGNTQVEKKKDSTGDEKAIGNSKHRFMLASVVSRFEYDEPSMTEEGFIYGINGVYEYHDAPLFFHVSLEYLFGTLDYDGMTFGGEPVIADTEDFIYEFRILTGERLDLGEYTYTPFIGFGMRYWNDVIKSSGGYERELVYYYSPIGFSVDRSFSKTWSWCFNIEYDLFWGGEVTSHLSDTDSGLSDPKNNQNFGDGHGMRTSIKFSNQFNKKYSLFIEPFFRYWDLSESDCSPLSYNGEIVAGAYEPANETKTVGLYLGLGF